MRTAAIIAVVLFVSILIGPTAGPAQVYDFYEANIFGYADKNNQALPKKLTLATTLPQKVTAAESYICIWHQTTLANPNKGKVSATCTITRGEDLVDKLKLSGKAENNVVCQCKRAEALKKNDMLFCKMKFSGYQKLRRAGSEWDWSDVAAGFARDPQLWCG